MRNTVVVLTGCLILTGAVIEAQGPPKAGEKKPAVAPKASVAAKIRDAMSAAPPDIAKGAMIMDWPDSPTGQMKQLRAGTNGWMCMPSTGGGVGADPMCLDKMFSNWADAYMAKKDPQTTGVGTAYMLRGDKGASNIDPFAEAPTASNQWVASGPHVMIIVPNPAQLDGYPTDPNNGGPFVMWKGTKYAHLMVPVASMPKTAAKK